MNGKAKLEAKRAASERRRTARRGDEQAAERGTGRMVERVAKTRQVTFLAVEVHGKRLPAGKIAPSYIDARHPTPATFRGDS